jgi:hypothetical protein
VQGEGKARINPMESERIAGLVKEKASKDAREVCVAENDNPATSTATGGKENVSTSVPPATLPENRAGQQHSDTLAMQREARRHSQELRREEDKNGQP